MVFFWNAECGMFCVGFSFSLRIAGYYFGMMLARATGENMIHVACNVSSPPLDTLLVVEHILSWVKNMRIHAFQLHTEKRKLTKYRTQSGVYDIVQWRLHQHN